MSAFADEIDRKRKEALERIRRLPIACLVWGPNDSSGTLTGDTRKRVKNELLSLGHHARYSEDLFDPNCGVSNLLQQVAQVEAFDVVFAIPDSPGSIAEINQFARIPYIGPKIVAYLDSRWDSGFSNKALIEIQSPATCKIQPYDVTKIPDFIVNDTLEIVKRLQEFQYLQGRR